METPEILWGMDPLLHVHLQLFICQVKALQRMPDSDGIFRHHSHPVRTVEIMGVVQSVHRANKLILYTLDDGTGVIQCALWIPDKYQNLQTTSDIPGLREHELGQVIRVVGQPSEFRSAIQVTFQPGDSSLCTDPNDETIFRLRVLNQERAVYSKPVVLPYIILSEIVVQEVKPERPSAVSELMLMDRVRAWVAERDEFCYLDFEDDEENQRVARSFVQATRPQVGASLGRAATMELSKCLTRLVSEGVIEYKSKRQMILRVVKGTLTPLSAQGAAAAVTLQEPIDADGKGLACNPIVLDDSEDERG